MRIANPIYPDIDEKVYPEEYQKVRWLNEVVLAPAIRRTMEVEDEILEKLEIYSTG
uniref:Uncharacterized protein n=1 Tax=Candidatus Kentrum sp. FW TaxID=2126338 RepID=A0A450THV6_9GAMM|nr:MAG: hypothetical protein BECKFW1821B_GA0114236_11206 [Candidatus Kentron sp. FW]